MRHLRANSAVVWLQVEEQRRKSARHRVHLAVRFASAREFVVEYAENLSQRGLFVKGAHELEPLSEVSIELELPGHGRFPLKAMVAHVLTSDEARTLGRAPGAGLAIVESPTGFDEALHSYLMTLGRRADHMVFVADDTFGLLLSAAGYQVKATPNPGDLVHALARASVPVVGIVVPAAEVSTYAASVAQAGGVTLVLGMDSADDFDEILVSLDAEL